MGMRSFIKASRLSEAVEGCSETRFGVPAVVRNVDMLQDFTSTVKQKHLRARLTATTYMLF